MSTTSISRKRLVYGWVVYSVGAFGGPILELVLPEPTQKSLFRDLALWFVWPRGLVPTSNSLPAELLMNVIMYAAVGAAFVLSLRSGKEYSQFMLLMVAVSLLVLFGASLVFATVVVGPWALAGAYYLALMHCCKLVVFYPNRPIRWLGQVSVLE